MPYLPTWLTSQGFSPDVIVCAVSAKLEVGIEILATPMISSGLPEQAEIH